MMPDLTILQAAVVWAGAGRVFAPGVVVFSNQTGAILAVGPGAAVGHAAPAGSAIQAAYPNAHIENHPHRLLMPGLVNAHCHLELGYLRGKLPAGRFVDWVIQLMRQVSDAMKRGLLEQLTRQSVEAGVAESLAAGVTTVGDITRQAKISRSVLSQAPLRAVSFGEVTGLGQRRAGFAERLAAAADTSTDGPRLQIGLSPHAPYTVEGPALRQAVQLARQAKLPLAMHLAELSEETEFLAHLTGPLRELWNTSGGAVEFLDDLIPLFPEGPVRWAERWGLFEAAGCDQTAGTTLNDACPGGPLPHRVWHPGVPVLLAHMNYVNDDEIGLLGGASVVLCPRTRAFFGHQRPHRYREMLAAGVNVCLGTDSLASNPDLSLLREAAALRKTDPTLPVQTILEMVTLRGAKALGMDSQIGSLAVGKQADIIALPLAESRVTDSVGGWDGVLEYIVTHAPAPPCVWIAGNFVKTVG